MNNYILEIGFLTQRVYAYGEVIDENYGDCPRCKICNRPIGSKKWLPPYNIKLRQRSNIGDIMECSGGPSMIITENVLNNFIENKYKGITDVFELNVKNYNIKKLYGINIIHSDVKVNYDASTVEWYKLPKKDICKYCGPGGGGDFGIISKLTNIIIENNINEYDIFFPINLSGKLVLSEKLANYIIDMEYTNCKVIKIDEYEIKY